MTLVNDTSTSAGKRPVQQRSKERVERMLAAARDLIAAAGSDRMKMSEVAEKAGVPIGSLYQFFPDKSALVRALVERTNAENRQCIEDGLAGATTPEQLSTAFGALFDVYYGMFQADPAMRDIWAGAQADKALRAVEIEESRVIGGMLGCVLKRLKPDVPEEKIDTAALLIMNLGEATIRLAISVPEPEGRALVDAYKGMAVREMTAL